MESVRSPYCTVANGEARLGAKTHDPRSSFPGRTKLLNAVKEPRIGNERRILFLASSRTFI